MDNNQLNPEQIKQMIMMLQQMLPQQEEVVGEKRRVGRSAKTKKQTNNTKPSKANPIKTKKMTVNNGHYENKFLDMSEMAMHKSDALIDKKLNKFPPTPRSRTFELIKVTCRVCGKKEEVHPKLVLDSVDRYKCNTCSTSQG